MRGIGRREMVGLAGIRADRLGAKAQHVALINQEPHRRGRRPRRVRAVIAEIDVTRCVAL